MGWNIRYWDGCKLLKGMWLVVWWWVAHCTLCTEGLLPRTDVSSQQFIPSPPPASRASSLAEASLVPSVPTTHQSDVGLLAESVGAYAPSAVPAHPPTSLLPPAPPIQPSGRGSMGSIVGPTGVGPPTVTETSPPLTTVASLASNSSPTSQQPPSGSPPTVYDVSTTILSVTSFNESGAENGTFIGNCSELAVEELLELENEAAALGPWAVIAIVSSLLAVVVLIAAVTYMLYRHSLLWNRPQTLSDKCSNDESTGYIDDSAFRENSEELYSLDNDSFLNSLEAMTIQNYWTEHVKHTKL